ncbi:Mitochondrial outer membrane protein iml2 [Orbilia oligospora]|uniref:Inclusion body clearance protein IML2 n=1 Tax=Orbilia oligospora TaxID=2813651 RepID=A0A8H8UQ54_ORBOL|nr:Mitochondrial outer membrane protein iml2 [Orbilia oligospora]
MNDNLEAAEAELETGGSVWHKLGQGAVGFIRSAAGFEQAVMKEASDNLAAAETAAYAAQRHATRSTRSTSSYPPGIEFALAAAESQLMSALIGVLSESIMEAMKSFYKMRNAFKALEGVNKSIQEIKAKRLLAASTVGSSVTVETTGTAAGSLGGEERGLLAIPDAHGGSSSTAEGKAEPEFKNAVDEYIESGGNLCYGTLLLFIGMIPPAMSRLLSILGFHGDRKKGLECLWESANMMNSHGALAALIILVYYQMLQFCDIVETDPEKNGMPREKCEKLLFAYRDRYPNSPLWVLEQARMCTQTKEVEKAIELLEFRRKPQMKQIEAICVFEKALNFMCIHHYEKAAQTFLQLIDLNSWSDAMYYYIAASCYVELYRSAVTEGNTKKSEEWGKKAEELFLKVATHLGKKKFMARTLPLETFTDRKVKKWQKFAKERKCTLVEAVGVSPLEEMIYMWNGFTRMNNDLIAQSLKNLEWQAPTEEGETLKSCITEFDEQVIQSFLKGVLARHQGEYTKSREIFDGIAAVDKLKLKEENWVLPSTQYEIAVVIWNESGMKESKVIHEYLTKCASWETYELDNRRLRPLVHPSGRLEHYPTVNSIGNVFPQLHSKGLNTVRGVHQSTTTNKTPNFSFGKYHNTQRLRLRCNGIVGSRYIGDNSGVKGPFAKMSDLLMSRRSYMTAKGLFKVEKHLTPAFPIREHPRGTWKDDDRLELMVNQYKPVNNPEPKAGDLTLIVAHANGFHKELYEPFFEYLVEDYEKRGAKLRNIWIADIHNQGESGVLNEKTLGGDISWFDHSRDVFSLIMHFPKDIVRPIAGIGHSMGGAQLFRASHMHPTLFTCLIGVDPVIAPETAFPASANPAAMSAKRRDIWPSIEDAKTFFKSRPFYQSWDPVVLDLHMKYGLRKVPTAIYPDPSKVEGGTNAVTLTTTKHQEVFTFWRTSLQDRIDPKEMFTLLDKIKVPVCYIQGETSVINWGNNNELKMEVTPKPCEMHIVKDCGHLVPQEKPKESAEIASEYLYRQVKIWGKKTEEFKDNWPSTMTISPRYFEPRSRESKI